MISDYELDRILAGDKALVPSREFTASVMTAVERHLSAPAAMSFPWRRMFAGLVAFVGALSAAFVGDPSLTDATTAVPPLDPPQALSLEQCAQFQSRGVDWPRASGHCGLGATVIAGSAGRKGVELPKL
jgi:hypothetical protein